MARRLVRSTPSGGTVTQVVDPEKPGTPKEVLQALGVDHKVTAAVRELVRPTGWGRQSGASCNWRGAH